MEPTVAHHPESTGIDLLTPLLLVLLVTGTIVFLWFSASAEEIYMALHVTAAAVWVGGGVALTIFAFLTQRAGDSNALANLVRQVETMATRVFAPASLVTLAFGIALVEKAGSGYGFFWIEFGFVVWGLSFVLGAGLIGPATARLRRQIAERGVDDLLVRRGIAYVLRLARIDAAMLLLVVVDMAAKPSF
jgi:uncharacterized membrane protein